MTCAITLNGTSLKFDFIWYCLHDLLEHGRIKPLEYELLAYWTTQYENGGAMPGLLKFVSVLDGDEVYFTSWLDDLTTLYFRALDNDDVHPVASGDADLYAQYLTKPIDIGRFSQIYDDDFLDLDVMEYGEDNEDNVSTLTRHNDDISALTN